MSEASAAQSTIDGSTRLIGIIGHPIAQVKSPLVFNPRFKAAGPERRAGADSTFSPSISRRRCAA